MKRNRQKLRWIFYGLVVFSGCFSMVLVFYYILCLSGGQYHSDCTDTILWTQAMLDGKSMVNPDFYYAALLPFGGNLLMWPFVALYGVTMKAQLGGMILFAVLFTVSLWLLVRSMKLSLTWGCTTMLFMFMTLLASSKLREIFWEHIIYYSLGAMTMMLGTALVFYCLRSLERRDAWRKKGMWLFLMFGFTVIASANGIQAVSIFGFPVLAALFTERFLDMEHKLFSRENGIQFCLTAIMAAAVILGIFLGNEVNGNVKAGYAEAYSSFSKSSDWMDNARKFFPQLFELMGVKVRTDMLLFSFDGVMNLCRILFSMILITVPVILLLLYRKIQEKPFRVMILIHHFTAAMLLVGWIFGKLNSACWRLSPILVTAVILCVLFIRWCFSQVTIQRIAILMILPFVLISLIVTREVLTMDRQTEENRRLTGLIDCLESNGLSYGYGTFWQANVVTLLSDSKVKVRCVRIDEKGCSIRYYQTNRHWYGEAQGYDRYFLVCTEEEFTDFGGRIPVYETMYRCEGFIILVYPQNIFDT